MTDPFHQFHANGKLLLSGEYFVLDGALALALPTRPGQGLRMWEAGDRTGYIDWRSNDHQGKTWFEGCFRLSDLGMVSSSDEEIGRRLQQLLQVVRKLNPGFPESTSGLRIESQLEFSRSWGLGSSSTLIYNIAAWSGTDPYELLRQTFGGSGYDLACAGAKGPIFYQLRKGQPEYQPVSFRPSFSGQLYFVYLGRKQNSREGIAHYRKAVQEQPERIEEISRLTRAMTESALLTEFETLIRQHEKIVGESLRLERAKKLYFSDYPGEIKSLGAWGGDFVLVTAREDETKTRQYFNEKGFNVFFKYQDLILDKG